MRWSLNDVLVGVQGVAPESAKKSFVILLLIVERLYELVRLSDCDRGLLGSTISPLWPSGTPKLPQLLRRARSSRESLKAGEPDVTCDSRCPSIVLLKSISSGGTSADDGIRDGCEIALSVE